MKKLLLAAFVAAIFVRPCHKESKYMFLYEDQAGRHFMDRDTFDEVLFPNKKGDSELSVPFLLQ